MPAAMADILVCEDRDSLVEAGHRARRAVEERYSDQRIIRQLIDTFTEAVSGRGIV